MQALDHAGARELLLSVVNKYYAERHSPLPGAFVKAQMLTTAHQNGSIFSERELNFRRFIDFIKSVPEVAIQGRSGSDILLAPVTATELLAAYAGPLRSIRRDFWRAFIEFPIEGSVRLYDTNEDKILYVEKASLRQGVEVEPISRETQIKWRKTFAEEQLGSVKDYLLAALDRPANAIFNEFSRRLRENPSVMRAWNHYLQKQITDRVASWATKHDIPEERWMAPSRGTPLFRSHGEAAKAQPQNISQRGELYNFLDQLPIEDLLQLRVPLEWVLKVTRHGNS